MSDGPLTVQLLGIRRHVCQSAGVAKVLVGNKSDLEAEREVSTEEGEVWARSKGMMFLECSAKTRAGIDQVFDELISKVRSVCTVVF